MTRVRVPVSGSTALRVALLPPLRADAQLSRNINNTSPPIANKAMVINCLPAARVKESVLSITVLGAGSIN